MNANHLGKKQRSHEKICTDINLTGSPYRWLY